MHANLFCTQQKPHNAQSRHAGCVNVHGPLVHRALSPPVMRTGSTFSLFFFFLFSQGQNYRHFRCKEKPILETISKKAVFLRRLFGYTTSKEPNLLCCNNTSKPGDFFCCCCSSGQTRQLSQRHLPVKILQLLSSYKEKKKPSETFTRLKMLREQGPAVTESVCLCVCIESPVELSQSQSEVRGQVSLSRLSWPGGSLVSSVNKRPVWLPRPRREPSGGRSRRRALIRRLFSGTSPADRSQLEPPRNCIQMTAMYFSFSFFFFNKLSRRKPLPVFTKFCKCYRMLSRNTSVRYNKEPLFIHKPLL